MAAEITHHFPRKEVSIPLNSKEELLNGIRNMVRTFVEEWKDCKDEELELREFEGGVTNKLYRCTFKKEGIKHHVLVRIYGLKTELLIDRDQELKTLSLLEKGGFGPKIFGTFTNGFVYEYFEGAPLSPTDLREGKWNTLIAQKLALWHKQTIPGNKDVSLWRTIDKWFQVVPESYEDEVKDKHLKELDVPKLRKEGKILEEELVKLNSPVVFTHNDLLGPNLILDERKGDINFIDYEYASWNYRDFDIANHFCEYAGFELDYSHYPPKERQYDFFRAYLKAFDHTSEEPKEEDLYRMYVSVSKFAMASNFFWATWALIQAKISDINFDFLDYGQKRFKQYYIFKDEFKNL